MSKVLRRLLTVVVSLIVLVALLVGYLNFIWVPQTAQKSFPQTTGELKLSGLEGPVDVYRDALGIPQIYATTPHDLFMAQGYIHAQDRFWQMDFWRHIGSGRLAEMFGKSQVSTDSFLRTLGWRQLAEQEYAMLSPESKTMLDAYAAGVNAYLAGRQPVEVSLEYSILTGVLNRGYKIEPWTPVHSLTWAKAMAWDLRGNMGAEIERAILLKNFSVEQVDELFPAYPADHPRIVPEIGDFSAAASATGSRFETSSAAGLPSVDYSSVAGRLASLDAVLGPSGAGIGSNSWAVSGKLTASGTPLLANDPHLGIQMPSIWYQIGLHCRAKTETCPFEVAGFSFAGVPGVVIGHNDRIAWAFTNTGPDVMDLYVLKVNPENLDQYEFNGQWVDFETRTETIQIAGGTTQDVHVRVSRFGPVISDTYGALKDNVTPTALPFKDKAGIDLPETYAIALRWTALEPGSVFEAIWGFNKAQNWQEFRQAGSHFIVPAQNLLYADVDGNIGYQMPGNVPIRKKGDGRLPVPGWTDEYDWTGYIPFAELPYVFNPPSGYIVTANNQVPPDDYKYLVTTDWDYGFRAQRIVDMITGAPGKIDSAYIQKMQGDSQNLNAATLVPLLLNQQAQFTSPEQSAALNLLQQWDQSNSMDSQAAALFERFWWNLSTLTFNDEAIPADYYPAGGSRFYEVMRNLVTQPNSTWWDDKNTPDKTETRDDIFAAAFTQAVAETVKASGSDPAKWTQWGDLHTSTFRNGTLGNSGIAPIENLFNRGPFRTGGGDGIVNATGWDIGVSYEVNWLPSMRMIVDLGNLNNSITVHTTGESGHAYHPHYIDMADLWRNIQYYPMLWDEQTIVSGAADHLQLVP